MREILFKCWIPSDKFMGIQFNPFEEDPNEGRWPSDAIFLQSTGLKDKNGKEIYEGDIIRIAQCECVGQSADGSEEEWIQCEGEVFFEDAMFVFEGHSAGSLPLYAYKDDLEIIGNIYSNPELLKP